MTSNKEISRIWIGNIKKLDEKHNLIHGQIYASDGSIHELNIDANMVTAKVQGKPGKIYDVKIKFKKFTKKQIAVISDYTHNNPMAYTRLLNNQIPDELLYINVKLFPDSLKDFEISCDCNRGLFCKHEAAVLHKLTNEISKDPFLIFNLRGFNLKEFIRNKTDDIKTISDVLKNDEVIKLNDSKDVNYLVKLNLLLSDYPNFFPSKSVNFNEVLCDTLASMSKCIYKVHNSRRIDEFKEYIVLGNILTSFEFFESKTPEEIQSAFEEKWLDPQDWNDFRIDLNGNYEINKIETSSHESRFFQSNLKYSLFAFLAEINQIDTTGYCEKVRFMHKLFLFTSKLININGLIPEFFRLDNDEYHIRWIPAFEKEIYMELEDFYEDFPKNILTFNKTNLTAKSQVNALISLIFEGFCEYFTHSCIPYDLSSYKNETYFRLFFLKSQDLNNYIYDGKEIEINNWLSSLYLKQYDYKLILDTKQKNFEFQLQLKIMLDDELYDFNQIAELKRMNIIQNVSVIQNIFSKSGIPYNLLNNKTMDIYEYSNFLDDVAPILEECGIEVKTPEEFLEVKQAKLVLTSNSRKPTASLSLDDLVDFDWKIAIGDELFSIDEFESFNSNFRGLVRIKDKYYSIDDENLTKLRKDINNIPVNPDKSDLIQYLLSSNAKDIEIDEKIRSLVDNILNVEQVDVPKRLNGNLRQYQKKGFSWLVQNMKLGFGSILADDMGLGKTIQIIALILYLKDNGKLNDAKVLIVVPTSILTNWAIEIEKFAPSLKAEIYHGLNRIFPETDYDILLTSYGIIRQDFEDFIEKPWFLLVIDEAQNIKNPNSKQTKAIKSLNAAHHIALSGTPIENHLGEYWSIFDFTNKGYLNTLKNFKKRFVKPITKERNYEVLDDFKKITSPFILRRLKTDKSIIKELPDKIINDIYCNLTVKQATMYDETLEVLIRDVEESDGIQRKGLVLKLINSLKQICNHPSQYLKTTDANVNESGKMEVLINIVENIIASDEKVLIFTQYVQMGKIIKKLVEKKFSQETLFLHGNVPRKKRDEMIYRFQNGDTKIFILSLKAGGIGLNLTAASNVIHYDLWWNPAVENQATDRAYRIGQKENVMVYRFITTGTLEERINKILVEKRELVDMAIDNEESFITEMSNEELRKMLDLRNS